MPVGRPCLCRHPRALVKQSCTMTIGRPRLCRRPHALVMQSCTMPVGRPCLCHCPACVSDAVLYYTSRTPSPLPPPACVSEVHAYRQNWGKQTAGFFNRELTHLFCLRIEGARDLACFFSRMLGTSFRHFIHLLNQLLSFIDEKISTQMNENPGTISIPTIVACPTHGIEFY